MISKESQGFLENLTVYLYSSGKREEEIREIVGELEDHLHEAEKHGKRVDDIIGMTPKEYMEQLANEMPFDLKGWLKYLLMIFIGVLAYIVMGDAIRGNLKYSFIECIGYPCVFLFSLLLMAMVLKYTSSRKVSSWKERILCMGVFFIIPMALFLALKFFGRYYNTPIVYIGKMGSIVAIVLSILVFIGLAIWSKEWDSIIIPAIIFLPEIFLEQTTFDKSTKATLSIFLTMSGMGLYVFILFKRNKIQDVD
ncbi:HAAS domain-containing protein [Baia soyae]|uniref:HAAS domain-containing protein n=1 Tax=Baia soyae TaxID=1544746 RepID=UPI001051924A|nr:hypothetical protein [Baia soyae]